MNRIQMKFVFTAAVEAAARSACWDWRGGRRGVGGGERVCRGELDVENFFHDPRTLRR